MKSINPADNTLIQEYTPHTFEQAAALLDDALAAWKSWRDTSLGRRASLLRALAERLELRKDEYARLITSEMGKTIREAEHEVMKCAWVCRWYSEHGPAMLDDQPGHPDAPMARILFEPLGPILAVMPWNFPFWQVFRFAAPALLAGNAVVLKHASNVTGCALAMAELMRDATIPKGLFTPVLLPGAEAEALVDHPAVRGVTLTGSSATGQRIAARAGAALKKCVMELGGSDPWLVLDDADVVAAAQASALARTSVAGQVCLSAKRIIVTKRHYDEFLEAHRQSLEAVRVGDPLDPATDMGPLARPDLVQALQAQVDGTLAKGARLLTGGKPLDGPGNFYPPTLLADVEPGMPAADEETFGPVSAVLKAKDEDHAMALANATPYGLGASVWTRDRERGERLARRVEAGIVYVNAATHSHVALPFGGIKCSGYGRELGVYGLREFMNIKTLWSED